MIKITSNARYIAELLNQIPIEETVEIIDRTDHIEFFCANQRNILNKPFRISELLDKLDALPKLLHFGEFTLNTNKKQLTFQKKIINLTEKEQDLIICLLQNSQGISKAALLEHICGYQKKSESHALETHISKIRRKTSKDLITCKNSTYFLNY